jgi:hypothetical protein
MIVYDSAVTGPLRTYKATTNMPRRFWSDGVIRRQGLEEMVSLLPRV